MFMPPQILNFGFGFFFLHQIIAYEHMYVWGDVLNSTDVYTLYIMTLGHIKTIKTEITSSILPI